MVSDCGGIVYGLEELDHLIGKRVMIRAKEHDGSARLLNGLMATVIAAHPFAANWCRIQLDPNEQTEFREWSIALDRLIVMPGECPTCALEARSGRASTPAASGEEVQLF